MLRAIGASAVTFLTFFITPVSASFDRPVDLREVSSAAYDLVEVCAQLAETAEDQGLHDLATAASALETEANDWYGAVRKLGNETTLIQADAIPDAHEALMQAYDDVAGRLDLSGSDSETPEVRTLWRLTKTRMRAISHAIGSGAEGAIP